MPLQNHTKTLPPGDNSSLAITMAFWVYELAWRALIPFLRGNQRLRQGFEQRTIQETPAPADLWIQAASVGEAHLAREIIGNLHPSIPLHILLTTGTSQGLEVAEAIKKEQEQMEAQLTITIAFLPFDRPALMNKALAAIHPRLMILLESELWPGLLRACRRQHIPVLLVNGRIKAASLNRYLFWPSLWRFLKPARILAISQDDATRFATLFGTEGVETVTNIKFDRIASHRPALTANPVSGLFPPDPRLIVLGSVRQEEEGVVGKMIAAIHEADQRTGQQTTIALFPRHLHRLAAWEAILNGLNLPWQRRSLVNGVVAAGSILLWDRMGELWPAFQLARAAFVGGSLAPLGGQNFLEPLSCGLKPVIGPSWSNFFWIGAEIMEQGMVVQVNTWQEATQELIRQSDFRPNREKIRQQLDDYIRNRQGGTRQTCAVINSFLSSVNQPS